MSYLKVTNFNRFQHYKNRKPPWIKFYVDLIDPHHPINRLPIKTRYLFDRLLLLAAEWENAIPNDPAWIARMVAWECDTKISEPFAKISEPSVNGATNDNLTTAANEVTNAINDLLKGRWLSQTTTRRRASKRASTDASEPASKNAPPETEAEKEKEPRAVTSKADPTRANGEQPFDFELDQLLRDMP